VQNSKELYDALVTSVTRKVPGFKVRFKDECWTQKVVAVLVWIFNRTYMTRYTTTLYPTVYWPSRKALEGDYLHAFRTLAHEYVHLWDRQYRGWVDFNSSYLGPQLYCLLALGALGAFWRLWMLACLIFLPLAYPWPSRGRTSLELRGFSMSVAVAVWLYGAATEDAKQSMVSRFTGWDYYRMWPQALEIRVQLDAAEASARDLTLLKGDEGAPFREVYALLKTAGALKE